MRDIKCVGKTCEEEYKLIFWFIKLEFDLQMQPFVTAARKCTLLKVTQY